MASSVIKVLTGDSSAFARIKVNSIQHLEQGINNLRKNGLVIQTKTPMVLSS